MNVALKCCLQQEYQQRILQAAPAPLPSSYRGSTEEENTTIHKQTHLPPPAFENVVPLTLLRKFQIRALHTSSEAHQHPSFVVFKNKTKPNARVSFLADIWLPQPSCNTRYKMGPQMKLQKSTP